MLTGRCCSCFRNGLFSSIRIVFVREVEIDAGRGHRPLNPGLEWPCTGTQPNVVLAPSSRLLTVVAADCTHTHSGMIGLMQNTSKWHQRHKQRLRNQLKKMILWISLRRTGLFVAIPVLINKRLLPDSRCVTIYPILLVRCGYNSHDTLITISHIYR